jgi:two-component system, cell cycle sensor histidine kinase and response regulator CckA
MPGISGSETFDRLRAIDPEIDILLSRGFNAEGQAQDILQRGCRGFIQKPFTLGQLSQKLAEIFRHPEEQK